jgi:phosphohistidine phosphatase
MTATLGACQTLPVSDSKTLVVMRHAKAEQSGPSDFERQLSDRGLVDAAEAGTWLAARDVVPDQALVSAAVRTQQTWESLAEGADWDLEGTLEDSLYEAGPESALDLVRQTEDHVGTLIVVGHNPTMSTLAALLDDGDGDDDAGNEMTTGFPTSAMAVFTYDGDWKDLDEASATLVAFHVGRG